ncbi:MAG: hypothetical protein FH758_08310 [Firmicutes bacterium]|nr:hypothetical protein [Bacillota bacterium]
MENGELEKQPGSGKPIEIEICFLYQRKND